MTDRVTRPILVWVVLLVGVVGASAQTLEPAAVDLTSSIERRESASEQRDRRRGLITVASTDYGRIIPSGQMTDQASTFGLGLHYVHDTTDSRDGQFFLTVRGGYKAGRPRSIDTHTAGYSLGADLQLNRNKERYGQFIVSADAAAVKDGARNGGATLEWDYTATEKSGTFIATASYLRVFPREGNSTGDVVPGMAYEYAFSFKNPFKVVAEYTFKNDLDGEDDYALSARFKLADTSSLRFGVGKGSRVFMSLTHTLAAN